MIDHQPLGLRVRVEPRDISPELLAELVALSRERADAPAAGGWRVVAVAAAVALLLSGGGVLASQQVERDLAPAPAGPVAPAEPAPEPPRRAGAGDAGGDGVEQRDVRGTPTRHASDRAATVRTDHAPPPPASRPRDGDDDGGGDDGGAVTRRDRGRDTGTEVPPATPPVTPPVTSPPPPVETPTDPTETGPVVEHDHDSAHAHAPECSRGERDDTCPADDAAGDGGRRP